MNEYETKDGKIFKTDLDIGEVRTSFYELELLERAEGRVKRGTNKTLQTALNSISHLKMGSKKKPTASRLKDSDFDEYGLNAAFYTDEQAEFIINKVKEYEAVYDTSDPYVRDRIITMSKLSLKMIELEAKLLSSNDSKLIKQVSDLSTSISKIAEELKVAPKQKKEEDKSKTRNSLAEMVRRYEVRVRSGRRERTKATKKMEERMAKIRAESIDGKFARRRT